MEPQSCFVAPAGDLVVGWAGAGRPNQQTHARVVGLHDAYYMFARTHMGMKTCVYLSRISVSIYTHTV